MAITKKQIKQWNESFNKLSKEEQKVAIAKDVLQQIKVKTIIPTTGTYCALDLDWTDPLLELDVQSNFNQLKNFECSVCALGAMMVSNVKFNNNFTFEKLNRSNSDVFVNTLEKYFERYELALIEFAFESWDIEDLIEDGEIKNGILSNESYIFHGLNYEEIEKACDFNRNINDESERMVRIMKNIIKNKGEFKP